ncbi:unnamed protein product [Caenorhabditis brenneri]
MRLRPYACLKEVPAMCLTPGCGGPYNFLAVKNANGQATEQCGGSISDGCPVQYVKLGQPQMNDDDDIRMWNSWYLDLYRRTHHTQIMAKKFSCDFLFTFKWKATTQCSGTMNIGCSPPYLLIGPKQMNEEEGIRMWSSLIFDLLKDLHSKYPSFGRAVRRTPMCSSHVSMENIYAAAKPH